MERSIEDLCAETLKQLTASGYTEKGVRKHAATYRLLMAYAREKQAGRYSERLGRQFMEERYGAVWDAKRGNNTEQANQRIVHLEKLWHYQRYGTIVFSARSGKKSPFICPANFMCEYKAFSVHCVNRDYALESRRTILYIIQKFLLFLDAQGTESLESVSASSIEGFCSVYADCSAWYLKSVASKLSIFMQFLHSAGMTREDKSDLVPKFRHVRNAFLPSSFDSDDIPKLLAAVDRCNAVGKRDFALLLPVIRLGLRSNDVRNIRLEDFDWKKRQLKVTQSKTGDEIALPLPDDVGWAVIEYLRDGRPITDDTILFVRHSPEGGPILSKNRLDDILHKYMRRAGIGIPKDQHRGLHSLRSSLARSMLEVGGSLPVIAEVLGHRSTQSTSRYLRIDMGNLDKCPIDPEEVFAE
jgi:site-specific recombinase XerD